jgi:hypothetical protein
VHPRRRPSCCKTLPHTSRCSRTISFRATRNEGRGEKSRSLGAQLRESYESFHPSRAGGTEKQATASARPENETDCYH